MMRWPRFFLLLALAPLAVAAACAGGTGDDDDDDDGVSPTPSNFDICQIVWASADAAIPNVYDLFLVDADRSEWTSGTLEYNVNDPIGVLYNEKALPSASNPDPVPASAAITTSGSFQLALGNGTETGGTIDFSDTAGQFFYSLDPVSGAIGGLVGTGFAMSFQGEWSDPNTPGDLTEGTGSASIAYLGSDLELGTYGSYAICYSSATAISSFERRTSLTVERVLQEIQHRAAAEP